MMRSLSTTATLVITSVLAVLLIAYVFTGRPAAGGDPAPHCTSQRALDQIKAELFRRAQAMRGNYDNAFKAVGSYSVLHPATRLYRSHHRGSETVTCDGSLVVDLPPGVAVSDGRHNLASKIEYQLEPSAGGPRLVMLGKADEIVVQLASASSAEAARLSLAGPQIKQPQLDRPSPTSVTPAPAPVESIRAARVPSKAQQRPAEPERPSSGRPMTERPHRQQRSQSGAVRAETRDVVARNAPAAVTVRPGPASPNPSFSCRRARTRGEIAVCNNPVLAALDRQMSAQFYRAVAGARPGQRTMLNRSRNRFLTYRDNCRSDSCIADAYRGRMREISDVMNGAW
jgi:hypothetical protein